MKESKKNFGDYFGDYGRLCYVSCWTSKSEETSSLCSKHTNKKGVRIKYTNISKNNLNILIKCQLNLKFECTKGITNVENNRGGK